MKFEYTEVWGFKHAIRGMRNPMNSWGRSDSNDVTKIIRKRDNATKWDKCKLNGIDFGCDYYIGDNDMKLAQKLIAAGSEHRKFMRQIFVSVDITAPIYWWKEFDTYKVGTTSNSTSTMHKLTSQPIALGCFETDDYTAELVWLDYIDETGDSPSHVKETVDDMIVGYSPIEDTIINFLEGLRQQYLKYTDRAKKVENTESERKHFQRVAKWYWKELVRWLPESWLQTRTVTMNYENILNMYFQREFHKLNEWSGKDDNTKINFCSWVLSLPYMAEFISAARKNKGD